MSAMIARFPGDRPGDWNVSFVVSESNEIWEMSVAGSGGFHSIGDLQGGDGAGLALTLAKQEAT